MDSLSETLGIGTENWLLFRVDEAAEPIEKTFEEAKEQATTDYIEEEGIKALTEAIEAAHEAVTSGLAEGKALEEVAAAQNLKLAEHLGMKKGATLPSEPNVDVVYRLASQTKTGELSATEVVAPFSNRALFVYVTEREFVESDQNNAQLNRSAEQEANGLRNNIVSHWFTAKFDNANVEMVRPKK